MAAAPELSELGAMRVELARLLEEEREISAVRGEMHAQIDSFPSPLVTAQARKLSKERRALHLRIDQLRVDINLLTRG
jgi:hypothetical protein